MSAIVHKKEENKSQPAGNTACQQKRHNGSSLLEYGDGPSESIAQSNLMEIISNSSQVKESAQLQAKASNYSKELKQLIQKKENSTIVPDDITGSLPYRPDISARVKTVQLQDAKEEEGGIEAKAIVSNAVARAAKETGLVEGPGPKSETDEDVTENEESYENEEASEVEPDVEDEHAMVAEQPSIKIPELEAEIKAQLEAELEEKFPIDEKGNLETDSDSVTNPMDSIQKSVQRVVQLGTGRPSRKRHAKGDNKPKRNSARLRNLGIKQSPESKAYFEQKKRKSITNAQRMGAFKNVLGATITDYQNYPEGSYGHGRWLYLTQKLKDLGNAKNDLMDFDKASVEIDHSPHDGSQRTGKRKDDEASRYRIAVPLPRSWHRRHKTTHGPGASRMDAGFIDKQVERIKNKHKYAKALEKHLLDTFSDGAIGQTGHKKITAVANHAKKAVDYAATNIPTSIYPGHVKNTPAITAAERDTILNALRARLAQIIMQPRMAAVVNPF
ncbi:MAG: hypothetical protein AAFN93_15715 [Bacteroidota bacterium]